MALMSTPPHKFVRPPCWYYRLYKIVMYDFRVVPNGIKSIPNLIKIHPAVLELNHAVTDSGWTDIHTYMTSPICVNFMHIVQRTHKKLKETYTGQKTKSGPPSRS
jgi:hypothetical protein